MLNFNEYKSNMIAGDSRIFITKDQFEELTAGDVDLWEINSSTKEIFLNDLNSTIRESEEKGISSF